MTKKPDSISSAITVDIFEPVTTRLIVKHPVTGEPVPSLWVDCVGPESEVYRTAIRKLHRAGLGHTKADDELEEAEYQADQSLSVIAACVVAWNEDGFGEFERTRVKDTLKKYPSLTRQIDAFVAERKNFFRVAGESAPQVS